MINLTKKKKILVADDEANVRQLVRRVLSPDYEVYEAADGEEAVYIAKSKAPDVILMDIMMPRMDGLNACYVLKNNQATKNIPVCILTALATDGNRELAQEVWGADRYLTKPFKSQDILNCIKEITKKE